MLIALINSPVARVIEKRYDTPDYPHIGLGYLAAYLNSKDIKCNVIDAKLERLTLDVTLERLKEIKPDLIGFTAMTNDIVRTAEVASIIKKELKKVITVIGGVHATALPKETLVEFSVFDFLIHNEGEFVLYNLIKIFLCGRNNKNDFDSVKGIAFRSNGDVYVNQQEEWITDLDSLPNPAWELFPKASEYPIMTARGCPFKCIFCMRPNADKVRKRSPENVVSEIENILNKYSPNKIVFWDETFSIDLERVNKILDLMIEKGLNKKVTWYTQTNVNTVNYQLFKKMKEASCFMVGLGMESGDKEILKATKKGITMERIETAVKDAKKAKLDVEGYFIFGHPNETKETANKTINFAVKVNPTYPVFGIMVPYPGTEIAKMAEEGIGGYNLISRNWSDYNKQIGNALELNNLSRKELEKLQLIAYLKVYIFNLRILDLLKFVVRYWREGIAFFLNFLKR